MKKEPVLKPAKAMTRDRRRDGKPGEVKSGEGAASALATLRELERNRAQYEPAAERRNF